MRTFILSIGSLLVFTGLVQAVLIDYAIVKVEEFFQTDTSTVVPDPDIPYEFIAFYEEDVEETAILVRLLDSSGTTELRILTEFPLDNLWEIEETFTSKTALDSAWPNALYNMEITTDLPGGPVFIVPLDFGSTDSYFSPVPQFSNSGISSGLLEFNFTQDFTLGWNAPSGFINGTDRLFIFVDDNSSGNEIIDLETDTFQSSFLISGGTLNPFNTYEVGLIFVNVVDIDTTSIPGHTGAAGFASITFFDIAHVPEPQTYGLLLGFAALGFVMLRRRR